MSFIANQFRKLPYPEHSFQGLTVIVTGSNVGLGKEAARHIARLGAAKVILAVRTISKGEEAAKDINESTSTNVTEVWQVDMGNFDSVKAFCKRAESLDRLDAVVENAGIATETFTLFENLESTVAVNVVGTFLMALNLLPILRKSGEKTGNVPRLVITSSEVHEWASFEERKGDSIFDELNKDDRNYQKERYQVSKLLEVFIIRALAKAMQSGKHAKQPVILNNVNPGFCHSELLRENTGFRAWALWLMKAILARTTEVGSRNLVAAASAGDESHGAYVSNCEVTEPSVFVRSAEGAKTQERIFTELLAILEKIQPGIQQNI